MRFGPRLMEWGLYDEGCCWGMEWLDLMGTGRGWGLGFWLFRLGFWDLSFKLQLRVLGS